MKSVLCVIAGAALLAGCGGDPFSEVTDGGDQFDTLNGLAQYVVVADSAAPGSWTVSNGQMVGTGHAVNSVLVWSVSPLRDGWVETESSRADRGGLTFRVTDPHDYYVLNLCDDGAPNGCGSHNLVLQRRLNGAFETLLTRDIDWPRGTVRTFRLQAEGPVLTVYVDGVSLGSVTDASPLLTSAGAGLTHSGPDAGWVSTFERFRFHLHD